MGYRVAETSGALLVKAITVERTGVPSWRAYNLTIANDHTYYVGHLKTWVHNAGPGDCWDKLPHNSTKLTGVGSHTADGRQTYRTTGGKNVYKGHDGRYYSADVHAPSTRTIDQILVDGKIPSADADFVKWYDNLSVDELGQLYSSGDLKRNISKKLRPGEKHEWYKLSEAVRLKSWGIKVEDIRRFNTKTTDLIWIIARGEKVGQLGGHTVKNAAGDLVTGPGSKTFHQELAAMIRASKNDTDFRRRMPKLLDRWNINSKLVSGL